MNDHAINGDLSWGSKIRHAAAPTPHPLIFSLAAGLRGDLQYPSSPYSHVCLSSASRRRRSAQAAISISSATTTAEGDPFLELVSLAALAPPPRPPSAAVAKRQRLARMRLEMLGDRKLRMARFLLEAAGTSGSAARNGAQGEGKGEHQRVLFSAKSVNKTRRLLVLLVETFGSGQRRRWRQRSRQEGDAVEGGNGNKRRDLSGPAPEATTANHSSTAVWNDGLPANPVLPTPQLEMRRDILALVRPVYSLLGQALLGEPGPARRLERQALAAAVALVTAALEATRPQPETGLVRRVRAPNDGRTFAAVLPEAGGTPSPVLPDERRVAECFAQVVILAVATKLDTFLDAIGGGDQDVEEFSVLQLRALADFGPREIELERLLRGLGAWDVHGDAQGWPHHAPPPPPTQSDTAATVGAAATATTVNVVRGAHEKAAGEDSEASDTPLSSLLAEADEMVKAFEYELAPSAQRNLDGEEERPRGNRWWQRVQDALLPRIEACRLSLSGGGGAADAGTGQA